MSLSGSFTHLKSDSGEMQALLNAVKTTLDENDLTDLQKKFLSGIGDINVAYRQALTESTWENLRLRIAQWISILPSVDLDPQSSEPVLELESLIAQKTSIKREFISPIRQIYSIVVSSPESKSKWEKKLMNRICLSPQVMLSLKEGKFSVTGKILWRSNFVDVCWQTMVKQGMYFYCSNCNGKYHDGCKKSPVEIKNNHLHPKHQLQLAYAGVDKTRGCYCCDEDLFGVFYYCSTCDFAVNAACAEKPPLLLAVDYSKWHDHTLSLFMRLAPLLCSLCALDDLRSPVYMCPPCGFVAHLKCLRNLPRVIRISRHPQHRISFTPSFDDQGDWTCSVCRTKINHDYGGYSCIKDGCSYAAHAKCATQRNIWDGEDLEGKPEEVEDEEDDDVEPFLRISDGIIQHFSHQHHHLRLLTTGDFDDSKLCQACVTPIYFGNFYSCTQCDFILHEACANLSRKIYHPTHPHKLVLVEEYDGGAYGDIKCSVCRNYCTGFTYKCGREGCRFRLHVQCATISEPLVHESHMHPLFLTSKPGEWRSCSVCKFPNNRETFNCIECDFALCFACATLPQKVRYKYDNHILTLSYGEETNSLGYYWCEACERKLYPTERFYTCNEHCCVTLHIRCVLGVTLYMRPGSLFPYRGKILDVVRNDHMTRPICKSCEQRTTYRIYLRSLRSSYCSLLCKMV